MPRLGANPMKQTGRVKPPSEVSVCTLVYIPERAGYWEGSFDVLKACLASIQANTPKPYDLMVLDNGSCPEVRQYLQEQVGAGTIDSLILCAHNIGKLGAWNVLFPACQGKYIAFTDSDVIFGPDWLERTMEVFDAFDNVGMVTGRPMRTEPKLLEPLLSSTLRYVEETDDAKVERGPLIPQEYLSEHERSLGRHGSGIFRDEDYEDIRITRQGVPAYASCGHFQCVIPRVVAMDLLPIEFDRPLGGLVENWDSRVNDLGLLRLSLTEPHVWHVGNSLDEHDLAVLESAGVEHEMIAPQLTSRASRPGLVARALRACARQGRMRRVIEKAYLSLFEALH